MLVCLCPSLSSGLRLGMHVSLLSKWSFNLHSFFPCISRCFSGMIKYESSEKGITCFFPFRVQCWPIFLISCLHFNCIFQQWKNKKVWEEQFVFLFFSSLLRFFFPENEDFHWGEEKKESLRRINVCFCLDFRAVSPASLPCFPVYFKCCWNISNDLWTTRWPYTTLKRMSVWRCWRRR